RMPTNTTSPSRISRAAAATISSAGVYSRLTATPSAPVVDRRRELGCARAEPIETIAAELREVAGMIAGAAHPLVEPAYGALRGGRARVPVRVDRVVPVVVALDRGGMRAARQVNHRADQESGHECAIRIAPDRRRPHQLLRDDDHRLASLAGRRADPGRPPGIAVPLPVRPLHLA